jgi:hypothetical protein
VRDPTPGVAGLETVLPLLPAQSSSVVPVGLFGVADPEPLPVRPHVHRNLGLCPVFHYRDNRIRAHVQLCWLVLLLIMRVVENATDDTWRNVRHELDRMHLVTLATADVAVCS